MYSKDEKTIDKIVESGYDISKFSSQELLQLLRLKGDECDKLFSIAAKKRSADFGKDVYIRGIIDISNYCICSCKFCGNAVKSGISRYRMNGSDIIKAAENAKKLGLDIVHLASGEDAGFKFDDLLEAVKEISSMGMKIELALGNKDYDELCQLKKAGADRFILKFETSDNKLFSETKLCSAKLADIYEKIDVMHSIGFQVGSGNIIGLPGQSEESIVNDFLKLNELKVNMSSTSVFMPNNESAFANEEKGDSSIALNFIALLRLFMKRKVCIPSNSTLGTKGKRKALEIGSNVLSLNMTPQEYSGRYSIYTGKDRYKADIDVLREYVSSVGMELSSFSEMFNEQ